MTTSFPADTFGRMFTFFHELFASVFTEWYFLVCVAAVTLTGIVGLFTAMLNRRY